MQKRFHPASLAFFPLPRYHLFILRDEVNKMDTIAYGILGAGFVAELHAEALASLPNIHLVGIADPDLSRAEKLAEKYGCRAFSSAGEMYGSVAPDAVSICIPTFLHADAVCEAAARGIHILCEKPLALAEADCLRMMKAEENSTSVISVAQVLRWWPEYRALHDLSVSGDIGPVHSLNATRIMHGTRGGWFADPELGGGALFDLMTHDADFMLWTLGSEIRSVYAVGKQNEKGAWQHVCATFLYHDGRFAVLEDGNDMPEGFPFTTRLLVSGLEGSLEVSSAAAGNIGVGVKTDSALRRLYRNEWTFPVRSEGNAQAQAFRGELSAFLEGIRNGASPLPLRETCRTIRLLNRVRESLETGSPVNVSAGPPTIP